MCRMLCAGVMLCLAFTCSRLDVMADDQPASLDQQLFESLDDELFSELQEQEKVIDRSSNPADKVTDQPSPPAVDADLQGKLGGEDLGEAGRDNRLTRVGESMRNVQQRIAQQDTSLSTQRIQEQIVADLDQVLKQLQQQCQACRGGQKQGKSQQSPKDEPAQGQASSKSPARQSTSRLGQAETADTLSKSQDSLLRQAWGHLPATMRQRMNSTAPEKFLPKYSKLIEDYFRRLSEQQRE